MALSKTFAVGELLTAGDVNDHLAHHVPSPGDPYATPWQSLTPVNGWEIAGQPPLQIRRLGLVTYVRGRLHRPDGPGPVAFIVPPEYRPAGAMALRFPVVADAASGPDPYLSIDTQTGDARIVNGSGPWSFQVALVL